MSDYYEHEIAGLKDALAESEAESARLRKAMSMALEDFEEGESGHAHHLIADALGESE